MSRASEVTADDIASDPGSCPLCESSAGVSAYAASAARKYFRCHLCSLIHADPAARLPPAGERARYLLHENTRENAGHVAFLSRLADVVTKAVPRGARGLDVGCGPTPVLGEILTSRGYPTLSWDPSFAAEGRLLLDGYDFVTCCEVVEHAYSPRRLLDQLEGCVPRGGVIAIRTELYDESVDFTEWWYQRDPTHVCFYTKATMAWIGRKRGWLQSSGDHSVTLYRVPPLTVE